MQDDAISRENAVHALRKALWDYEDKTEKQFRERDDLDYEEWYFHRIFVQAMNDEDVETICQLPSVTQKSGKWIPVSERLPEEYGEYLVTWKTNDSSTPFISVCEYETSYEYDVEKHRFKGEWLVDDYILVHSDYEVVAWMPLPKPYEPQESEE